MTTKDFVNIENRLLPSLPGFAVKGRLLSIYPIEHTLRGFHFEPSAFSKKHFHVNAFFMPLYVPTKHAHFTFGHRLNRRQGWHADQSDLETALRSQMQRELPFLVSLTTPTEVAQALEPFTRRNNPHSHEAFAYTLVQVGEVPAALRAIDALLKLLSTAVPWQQEIALRAQSIRAKLLAEPEEAKQQLAKWEAETTSNLHLTGFRSGSEAE